MTKIDIFSGFLGAGKTTLIKKLIEEAYPENMSILVIIAFLLAILAGPRGAPV